MRLLHYNALGKLVLTDFRGKPIPPYAILSHRWSDSEILIEDVSREAYKEKEEGYKKLKFCAEQAVRDELQYFWIDTCCIDRWNKTERSWAINSMFQWYKSATRCYVFLSDVSVSTETEPVQRSDWETSFRASAWFTRGWTLQELIAPVSVEFFSSEGHRIGDKLSLNQLLHDITSIPLAALRNCSLDQFSISERRRWVENRETTEEEDIVYCLLGVLGVSMPTTYGEGQESAWRRLQAEVETAGSAPSIIPFTRNEFFVGRELQLAELEAKLFSSDQTTTTLAIVGPGGAGKSQLALEAAHRTRQNNRDCSVFWIDASGIDSLYQSYANIAQKLCIPGWDDDQADMKWVMRRCTAEMSVRQCLLIFDNVEDTTLRPSASSTTEPGELVECLPKSRLCSAIFTTTNSDTARALAPQNVIALRELTQDIALRMLQSRLVTPLSNTEQQEAKHLLRELLYLPLAIVQAAACINASGMTVQEYQSQQDEHKELALKYSSDTSTGQISRNNAFAVDCLFLAACVDRKDIPLELLETASPQKRQDAIELLNKYALITRRPAESALDVHRLVHQALRKLLQVQEGLRQWTERTIAQLLRVFPDNENSNRSKWRRFLPHAQYALLQSVADHNNNNSTLELAQKCAMALYSDGRYNEAGELEVQVMETRKRVLGDEHPDTLTSMANLASTYWNQGRWKEAEELQAKELGICSRVLGDEHPDTLTSMHNFAYTLKLQARHDEALVLIERCFQSRRQILGEHHPNTRSSLDALNSWRAG
ncbi:hypothetical protein GGP41_005682 [Bipolaris sorokiniana]|uniref:AAA+ ATPase domain-containing protein n=2 Tax=Cochliobolus sativus TaxID=45130 RepID=A0A8H6DUD7_COCSA|nr:hypothetical protein GGP41_005682 [Bipolaris sorokiniana]